MSVISFRQLISPYSALLGAVLLLAAVGIIFQIAGSGTLWSVPGFLPQIALIFSLALSLFPEAGRKTMAGTVRRAKLSLLLGVSAIALPVIPLSVTWAGLHPYYSHIGGVVPWSDAAGYYVGAESLLHTGNLDTWSQRRPLNAILLAVRFVLSGEDFRGAMVIQAGLFGLSALAASWVVAKSYGIRVGIALYALLFAFAALYLPTTLSEALGITLGCVAFTALWIAVERKSLFVYVLGLFFLAVAFSARPGAMLTLVTLIVAAGRIFRQERPLGITAIGVAVGTVAAALAINRILLHLYGDGTGASFSNFSTVLYGLVVGGKGWTQVYADFPILGTLPESAAAKFIYQQAWERFTSAPWLAVKAVAVGMVVEPLRYLAQMARLLFLGSDGDLKVPAVLVALVALPLALVVGMGLIRWMKSERSPELAALFGYFWLGFWLSLPFFYMDGGIRSVAATHPLAAATIVLALFRPTSRFPTSGWRGASVLLVAVAAILVVVVVSMPALMPSKPAQQQAAITWSCPDGERAVRIRMDGGTPRVEMRLLSPMGPPCTGLCEFSAVPPTNEGRGLFNQLRYPKNFALVYDAVSDSWLYVVGTLPAAGEVLGCAEGMREGKQVLWRLNDSDRRGGGGG